MNTGSMATENKTALIVDDEDAIRFFVGAVLRRRGFAILEATTLREAEGAWKACRGQADLAVIDIFLGSENGIAFAAAIKTENPQIRIVLTTGYLGNAFDIVPFKEFATLLKPFTRRELEKAAGLDG
jgi:DNA-binding NtrC family response regulator